MHSWLTIAAQKLAQCPRWTYAASHETATEPSAFAALALLACGESKGAGRPLDWLVRQQAQNGSLGVTAKEATPCWPTALAVLAWQLADERAEKKRYTDCCRRACHWLLSVSGTTPVKAAHVGHDTTIPGWPWVVGTHSWLEPTVFSLLALEASGWGEHDRAKSARALIIDRLLPRGGANYGNTVVLSQELLPHLQPSGIALCAIPRDSGDPRVQFTIEYLQEALPDCMAPHSLSFGLMGLAAHGIWPNHANAWLARSFKKLTEREESAYSLALLCLAGLGTGHPLQTGRPVTEVPSVLRESNA